jgi:two-component system KDP operon response regulator KdpE
LAVLIGSASNPVSQCRSLRQFNSLLERMAPALVITRLRLTDGYSDDVLASLARLRFLPEIAVIVIAEADCTQKQEARQLRLGADSVLKDPLKPDVLLEYSAKFLRDFRRPLAKTPVSREFDLAGATIIPDLHQLRLRGKKIKLSPKETELARILAEFRGRVATYDFIYSELFSRTFSGDTANLRVLFGKLVSSFRKLRIDLRAVVQVLPKSGYRCL